LIQKNVKLLIITIGLIVTVIGSTSFVSNVSAEVDSLPEWVKNVAGFWANYRKNNRT